MEILRASGWLDLVVAKTVARFRSPRVFAGAMIAVAGALACLVTNDVALFVVIPFTVVASRMSRFDIEDAVILQIVAANLLGCLTPLGNPQNLFVFHRAGWSAAHFVAVMSPFVAWSFIGLLLALLLIPKTSLSVAAPPPAVRSDAKAAIAGLLCFALVLLEIARLINGWPAAMCALLAGAFLLRRRFFTIDLSIIPLFFFAFIVVEGLRTFDVIPRFDTYFTSMALSQVISNVPATVLLSPFATDWRELLYGVNAGGCGTIIASLANLLGWRIYARECGRDPRFLWRLLAINFTFLAWAGVGGWVLLSSRA